MSCLVDYKGFRSLIIAEPPITGKISGTSGLSYGFYMHDNAVQFECADFKLKSELVLIGQVLNLEQSLTKSKVYNQTQLDERTLVSKQQQAQNFQTVPISNKIKLYAHNGLYLSNPEERSLPPKEIHKEYIEMVYYLSDTASIFPLDMDT